MRDRLEGQVAIVTGAAQGMGAACSRRLAEEGAAVALVDLNEAGAKRVADEIVSRGGVATATGTDVTDEAQVGAMVQSAVSEHGPVGILVNCAGVIFRTRISDITKAEWDKVLDVNLNGTFLCCAATLGGMKENHYGRIVNISSTAGRSVSTLGGAHYTASKAAVIGFTRSGRQRDRSLRHYVERHLPGTDRHGDGAGKLLPRAAAGLRRQLSDTAARQSGGGG